MKHTKQKKAYNLVNPLLLGLVMVVVIIFMTTSFSSDGFAFVKKHITRAEACITPPECSTSLTKIPNAKDENADGYYDGIITTSDGKTINCDEHLLICNPNLKLS